MKNRLNKLLIPCRIMGLTHNVWQMACVYESDGKAVVSSKKLIRSNEPYPCYSVSKSTTALALGFAYDRGCFDPADRLCDHLGEYFDDTIDPRWREVTIDHLLHHKTGNDVGDEPDKGLTDFDDGEGAWGAEDNLKRVLSTPIIHSPGEVFKYSDANYYVLARLAEKYLGCDLNLYLARNLFGPLGFFDYSWTRDRGGHVMGGTGLALRTEDFARLGWLWLNKGEYDGVRYISEKWFDMALDAVPDKANVANYGYGVRRLSEKCYSITGAFGQGAYINVDKRIVYAWNARKTNLVMTMCEILDKTGLI